MIITQGPYDLLLTQKTKIKQEKNHVIDAQPLMKNRFLK